MTVGPPDKGGFQALPTIFESPLDEQGAIAFVDEFGSLLSAWMAQRQKDGWYGNLFIDIDWHSWNAGGSGAEIAIAEAFSFTLEQPVTSTPAVIQDLTFSPYAEILVDGMKAAHAKAKFIYWFVLLEELEGRKEFQSLFTPLFSTEEVAHLKPAFCQLEGKQKDKLLGVLNAPRSTVQSRQEKLHLILRSIGVSEVASLNAKKIEVSVKLCKRLIDTRNALAHKGEKVDEELLYGVLFPLAQRALIYLAS